MDPKTTQSSSTVTLAEDENSLTAAPPGTIRLKPLSSSEKEASQLIKRPDETPPQVAEPINAVDKFKPVAKENTDDTNNGTSGEKKAITRSEIQRSKPVVKKQQTPEEPLFEQQPSLLSRLLSVLMFWR